MFLATTALDAFWDRRQNILFLGTWCLRQDRRDTWEGLSYRVLPSPWDDRPRFYEAASYLDACSERMLPKLAECLNSIHDVSHGPRYWRILLGPWLIHFLHAAYDRYVHLNEALRQEPKADTILLDASDHRSIRDAADWTHACTNDKDNLQLFSGMLSAMGLAFPTRRIAPPANDPARAQAGGLFSLIHRSAQSCLRLAARSMRKISGESSPIALDGGWGLGWRLAWKSGLRILPYRSGVNFQALPPAVSMAAQRRGLVELPAGDDFERLCWRLMEVFLPTVYLESYHAARQLALRCASPIPKVAASSTAWYCDEPFKFFAAETSERGGRILTIQNGGGYGLSRYCPQELHESRIADRFMVWGWASPEKSQPCRNLPSPKISALCARIARPRASDRSQPILFVPTEYPRYLHRFQSTPVGSQFEAYFSWQARFLKALTPPSRGKVVFKSPHDFEQGTRTRLAARFPEVRWVERPTIYHWLRKSRLAVIDYFGTVVLETIAANLPTVVFWDPHLWEMREEATEYLDALRRADILFDDPESAAVHVERIYADPWDWWGKGEVQEARARFARRYALADTDCVSRWVEALEEAAG